MVRTTSQANAVKEPTQQQNERTASSNDQDDPEKRHHIIFDASAEKDTHPKNGTVLYIPGPRDRDQGHPFVEMNKNFADSRAGKLLL